MKMGCFNFKSGYAEAFIGRLVSCVTVNSFSLKQLCTAVKSVITNVLVYKAALNLKFKCACVAMCSLVMSPFLCA